MAALNFVHRNEWFEKEKDQDTATSLEKAKDLGLPKKPSAMDRDFVASGTLKSTVVPAGESKQAAAAAAGRQQSLPPDRNSSPRTKKPIRRESSVLALMNERLSRLHAMKSPTTIEESFLGSVSGQTPEAERPSSRKKSRRILPPPTTNKGVPEFVTMKAKLRPVPHQMPKPSPSIAVENSQEHPGSLTADTTADPPVTTETAAFDAVGTAASDQEAEDPSTKDSLTNAQKAPTDPSETVHTGPESKIQKPVLSRPTRTNDENKPPHKEASFEPEFFSVMARLKPVSRFKHLLEPEPKADHHVSQPNNPNPLIQDHSNQGPENENGNSSQREHREPMTLTEKKPSFTEKDISHYDEKQASEGDSRSCKRDTRSQPSPNIIPHPPVRSLAQTPNFAEDHQPKTITPYRAMKPPFEDAQRPDETENWLLGRRRNQKEQLKTSVPFKTTDQTSSPPQPKMTIKPLNPKRILSASEPTEPEFVSMRKQLKPVPSKQKDQESDRNPKQLDADDVGPGKTAVSLPSPTTLASPATLSVRSEPEEIIIPLSCNTSPQQSHHFSLIVSQQFNEKEKEEEADENHPKTTTLSPPNNPFITPQNTQTAPPPYNSSSMLIKEPHARSQENKKNHQRPAKIGDLGELHSRYDDGSLSPPPHATTTSPVLTSVNRWEKKPQPRLLQTKEPPGPLLRPTIEVAPSAAAAAAAGEGNADVDIPPTTEPRRRPTNEAPLQPITTTAPPPSTTTAQRAVAGMMNPEAENPPTMVSSIHESPPLKVILKSSQRPSADIHNTEKRHSSLSPKQKGVKRETNAWKQDDEDDNKNDPTSLIILQAGDSTPPPTPKSPAPSLEPTIIEPLLSPSKIDKKACASVSASTNGINDEIVDKVPAENGSGRLLFDEPKDKDDTSVNFHTKRRRNNLLIQHVDSIDLTPTRMSSSPTIRSLKSASNAPKNRTESKQSPDSQMLDRPPTPPEDPPPMERVISSPILTVTLQMQEPTPGAAVHHTPGDSFDENMIEQRSKKEKKEEDGINPHGEKLKKSSFEIIEPKSNPTSQKIEHISDPTSQQTESKWNPANQQTEPKWNSASNQQQSEEISNQLDIMSQMIMDAAEMDEENEEQPPAEIQITTPLHTVGILVNNDENSGPIVINNNKVSSPTAAKDSGSKSIEINQFFDVRGDDILRQFPPTNNLAANQDHSVTTNKQQQQQLYNTSAVLQLDVSLEDSDDIRPPKTTSPAAQSSVEFNGFGSASNNSVAVIHGFPPVRNGERTIGENGIGADTDDRKVNFQMDDMKAYIYLDERDQKVEPHWVAGVEISDEQYQELSEQLREAHLEAELASMDCQDEEDDETVYYQAFPSSPSDASIDTDCYPSISMQLGMRPIGSGGGGTLKSGQPNQTMILPVAATDGTTINNNPPVVATLPDILPAVDEAEEGNIAAAEKRQPYSSIPDALY